MTTITPQEFIREWVHELRDGDYQQGRGYLHRVGTEDETEAFCCLGVACELGVKYGLVQRYGPDSGVELVDHYAFVGANDDTTSSVLPAGFADWLGLGIDPQVLVGGERRHLSSLNDNDDWPFAKLADVIEETYLR